MSYRYRWVIIGVLWTAYIVVFMQRLSIGPLGPFIKEEMGLTSTEIGSLVSAASFGYMVSMIPAGWATDHIDLRRIILLGEIVGGIFMIAMLAAPTYPLMLAAMAISGLGCGCLMPSTTKGVLVWFPVKERATVMGVKQTGVNVAGVATAIGLPWIALELGWRYGFLFLGIIAIAIGLTSFVLYKDPPAQPAKAGTATDYHPAKPNKSLKALFSRRDVWLISFAGLAIGAVDFALVAHLVLYLTEVLLFSVLTAGFILAVTQAGGILGKPFSGILSDRLFGKSRRKVFVLWAFIACAALLAVAFGGSSLSWALYPILFLVGITATGWGGVHLTLTAEMAGSQLAGRAVGIVGTINYLGFVIGPLVFGYVVDSTGSYQWAWLLCAFSAALCAIAVVLIREEKVTA